ncbi:MAG: DUF167 domain-containing protein [Syntrophobacteraceae bacterium]
MNAQPWLRDSVDGSILDVYVQPRAGKTELAGIHEGKLKIRLSAPPVEGEANKECIRFLSKLIGMPKSAIEIIQGHKSRHKKVLIHGASPGDLQAKFNDILL